MTIANTPSGEVLLGFIERIEVLLAEKSALGEDAKVVMAEAKAQGYSPKAIRYCIKQRAMNPHDREENQALRDMYMRAIGLDETPPLFRFAGLIGVDVTARDEVITAAKNIVPADGELIIKTSDGSVRLWRDKQGEVQDEPYTPPAPPPASSSSLLDPARRTREQPPVPDVDDDGAANLGRTAYQKNQPITSNPFPHGDDRRRIFDQAWREAAGTDGMGPQDEDEDA